MTGVNFAWYLAHWLRLGLGTEAAFWRTANPARCHALFTALLPRRTPQKLDPKQPKSLHDYILGGD